MEQTVNKIEKIINQFNILHKGSSSKSYKTQSKLMQELESIDKSIGNTLAVGRLLKIPTCDSQAFYVVTEIKTMTVKVAWIPYLDAWESSVVRNCAMDRELAEQFAECSFCSANGILYVW